MLARRSTALSTAVLRTARVGALAARSLSTAAAHEYKYLTKEQRGPTMFVTLNRPDLHNAFNEEVIAELTHAFKSISAQVAAHTAAHPVADASFAIPRAVVLAGNGPSFSAGADLNWMAKMAQYTEEENRVDSLALYDMFHSIHACPLPVIARVNGAALGGGSGLVAACDFALALESAKLGFTEVGLGLIPAVISRFCIDKIGAVHASRYFLTGERFDAKEAHRIGLVSAVYPTVEELDAAVDKVTNVIAGNSPAAVRAAKQLVKDVTQSKNLTLDKEETKGFLTKAIAGIRVSEEGQAGLKAFLNKKKAPWVVSAPKKE